jgi:zinc transport system substrate-binding protein
MNKIILIIFFSFSQLLFAKVNVAVSILPQQTFVKNIGGSKVNITVMVKPGNSPHSYEPKPSQMIDISKANLYLSIGVEFEKSWLEKFKNQNQQMKIFDISVNVPKNNNPHIWTTPSNVKIIATNIYNALAKIDKQNQLFYKKNLDKFILKLEKLDTKIKTILQCIPKNSKFMVFHPAWGDFAKEYNLIQLSVELDGKEPKPKALIKLMQDAKKYDVKAIFTQPEFSTKTAKLIANQLNIKVVKVTPINPKWEENLLNFSRALCH